MHLHPLRFEELKWTSNFALVSSNVGKNICSKDERLAASESKVKDYLFVLYNKLKPTNEDKQKFIASKEISL